MRYSSADAVSDCSVGGFCSAAEERMLPSSVLMLFWENTESCGDASKKELSNSVFTVSSEEAVLLAVECVWCH